MKDLLTKTKLDRLADAVIRGVLERAPHIREGVVMTTGIALYRRLDCDGRALAYVRTRVRKKVVRIDVSGLWIAGPSSPLAVANAGGAITLVVRDEADLGEAVAFLVRVVEGTRSAGERRRQAAAARGTPGDSAHVDSVM